MTFLIKCDILRNGSYPTPIRQKDFNYFTEVAMLPEQRLAYITNSVRQQKYCSIQQLAKDAGVSAATIRRDLQYLSSQEQVRLTRGGAMHVLTNAAQEPAYAVKSTLNYEEKTRIGLAACKLVHPGETILLDTGTTVYQMTPGLKEMDNITVVTNDVRIAAELATSPGLSLCILGGQVRQGHYTTTGFWTQQSLENLHVDRMFLSCDAVDLNAGCSITNAEEIIIKQKMIQASNECNLLADHSKFESIAFMKLCNLEKVHSIITGDELDAAIVKGYRALGINMILA